VLKLEELSWPELEALDRGRAVIFVPVSPIEEHGPHLPLGTDMYTCLALAEAIALRLEEQHPGVNTVLAPPLPLGSGTIPYLGTIRTPPRLVRQVLVRVGRAFARDGFPVIVAISGHLGLSHILAMEAASRKVSRRYGVRMIAPVASVWRQAVQSQELKAACAALPEPITGPALAALLRGHHGGALETSLMLHVHPELVHPAFRNLARVRIRHFARWRSWTRERWPGYVGDPAMARADFGHVMLTTIAALGADLIARVMAGDALADGEVMPLTGWLERLTLRAGLALGAVGLAGGLASFWLRVWRQGRRTKGDSA